MLAKVARICGAVGVSFMLFSLPSLAQMAETAQQGKSTITLTPYEFLTPEELVTLRLVMTNPQALEVFVPSQKGYAVLAVNSEEGFIRNGSIVASAIALTGFSDPGQAEGESLKACEAVSKVKGKCEIVLTVETKD